MICHHPHHPGGGVFWGVEIEKWDKIRVDLIKNTPPTHSVGFGHRRSRGYLYFLQGRPWWRDSFPTPSGMRIRANRSNIGFWVPFCAVCDFYEWILVPTNLNRVSDIVCNNGRLRGSRSGRDMMSHTSKKWLFGKACNQPNLEQRSGIFIILSGCCPQLFPHL